MPSAVELEIVEGEVHPESWRNVDQPFTFDAARVEVGVVWRHDVAGGLTQQNRYSVVARRYNLRPYNIRNIHCVEIDDDMTKSTNISSREFSEVNFSSITRQKCHHPCDSCWD